MPCRNRSRSSVVMRSQRAAMRLPMRRRAVERPELLNPKPPKRMRQSTRSPSACQKVISGRPKSAGSSQFHSCRTTSPPIKTNSTIPSIASGAIQINFFIFGLIFSPSWFRKIVVNTLQPFAQMHHRVTFSREQRVHADSGLGGHLLEAAAFKFMRDKHRALVAGQLLDRQLEFLEKDVAGINRLRSGIGR